MSDLEYFDIAATFMGGWVDLNDGIAYTVATDPTLTSSAKTRRKILATSPVLDGDYLIHATDAMVTEQLKFWVYGIDQAELASNLLNLESIFDQYDYRVRIVADNYQEIWTCQMADITIERSQVYLHNLMAGFTATVMRFPTPVREELV